MIKLKQNMDEITTLLTRGVDTIYPTREELEKILRSGKKITLYQGFDPSGTQLHIGHAVGLRKLRQFQDLGNKVIFLIGDFTGMIGDPSGKKDARKPLTREQVLENAKDYTKQAKKILRFDGENPVEIKFNSDWNSKLSFEDVLRLASQFSVQQMIERDMFQQRLKEGREINLVEFLYPIMVANDAVAMNVDLEIGGTDQTFNMLAGRKLHQHKLGKEKFVLTVPLLSDSSGRKIGKSEGNVIALTDDPVSFYAKIMALGDDAIIPCFTLLTDMPDDEIHKIKQAIDTGENPMTFKKKLAFELTKWLNGEENAKKGEEAFVKVVQKGELPEEIEVFSVSKSDWNVLDLLVETKLVESKSEARRLLDQKAIEVNGKKIDGTTITVSNNDIVKVGKHRYIKITIKN
jgi:tyrosyl-tRNA synthetase